MSALSWWLTYLSSLILSFQDTTYMCVLYIYIHDGMKWHIYVQNMVLDYLGSLKSGWYGCHLDWIDGDVHAWVHDHRRMSKEQTMCSESDYSCCCSQCVGLNSVAKNKYFRSDLIHYYHPKLVFTHTHIDRTLHANTAAGHDHPKYPVQRTCQKVRLNVICRRWC